MARYCWTIHLKKLKNLVMVPYALKGILSFMEIVGSLLPENTESVIMDYLTEKMILFSFVKSLFQDI